MWVVFSHTFIAQSQSRVSCVGYVVVGADLKRGFAS